MEGERLSTAKAGCKDFLNLVLHPDDHIGVFSFEEEVKTVLGIAKRDTADVNRVS